MITIIQRLGKHGTKVKLIQIQNGNYMKSLSLKIESLQRFLYRILSDDLAGNMLNFQKVDACKIVDIGHHRIQRILCGE